MYRPGAKRSAQPYILRTDIKQVRPVIYSLILWALDEHCKGLLILCKRVSAIPKQLTT